MLLINFLSGVFLNMIRKIEMHSKGLKNGSLFFLVESGMDVAQLRVGNVGVYLGWW